MKVTIHMKVPAALIENPVEKVNIRTLIMDALYEFAMERTPAEQYVATRYPDGYCGDKTRDPDKVKEVKLRVKVSEAMRQNLDIETVECDASDDCGSCHFSSEYFDTCQDPAVHLFRGTET